MRFRDQVTRRARRKSSHGVTADHGHHGDKKVNFKLPTRHPALDSPSSFSWLETEPENFRTGIIRALSPVKLQSNGVEITKNPATVGPKIPGHHAGVDFPRKPEALQDGIIGRAEKFLKVERDYGTMVNRRMHSAYG